MVTTSQGRWPGPHPYGGMGGAIYFGEFGTLTLAIP